MLKNRIKYVFLAYILIVNVLLAQVKFDADFESGNLQSVSTSDSITYYVDTIEDIQGRWFYFRISGVHDKFIRVVINTLPHDFTKAMYSYDNTNYLRFSNEESPEPGIFQKTFEEDTVYVSYYTPYTYGRLQTKLIEWNESDYVSIDTLGYTINSFPIQEMIITDPESPDEEKDIVWIHARTHPSETPSSWHFEGIVKELLSNTDLINFYLSKIKFHLIPFVNPDGVYFGRSRTNFNYIDVESNWDKSEEETSQEVKILRARMKELNDEKPFSVFLNLHSQASSYCTFWIHSASSTSSLFFRKEMQFCNLNVSDNSYFLKSDFSFSELKPKYPEGWLWDNYGEDVMALTYETPYNNYFYDPKSEYEFIEVTNENLFEIGSRTVYAIAEYLNISHPERILIDNLDARYEGESPTLYSTPTITEFYGEDFAVLDPNNATNAIYETDVLQSGVYDISTWWVTNPANSFETEFSISTPDTTYEIVKTQRLNGGQWNYLTSIELLTQGTIEIKLSSNSTGFVIADAFRITHSGSITSVIENMMPTDFVLYQNYPNPFNPSTTIRYSVPLNDRSENKVSLRIYNVLGQHVATLVDETQSPGEYEVVFSSLEYRNLASGQYFYSLQIGNVLKTKKMILLK